MSWERVKLGEVLPFKYGKGLPKRERNEDGLVPVYSSAGMTGKHDSALIDQPCIVIGRKGTIGSVYFVEDPSWPIDTAFYSLGTPSIDLRFGFYLLQTLPLSTMNNDSAVPGLNRAHAEDLDISIPEIAEQRRIAHVLGALDDKIESNQRQIDLSSDLVDQFAISWSSDIEWCELSSLALQRKISVNPSKLENQEVALLSIPAFDNEKTPEIVNSNSIMSNKLLVEQESILVSRLNPRFFRSWYFNPQEYKMALTSPEFLVLATGSGEGDDLTSIWLAIRHPSFHEEMLNRVTGTSGSHQRVRPDDVLSIEVPDFSVLPSEKKRKVYSLLRRGDQLRRENQTLKALRDTLLPELLSGRITPEQLEVGL